VGYDAVSRFNESSTMSHDVQIVIFSFTIAVTPPRFLDIGADAVDVAATVEVVAADVDVDFRFHLHTALFN